MVIARNSWLTQRPKAHFPSMLTGTFIAGNLFTWGKVPEGVSKSACGGMMGFSGSQLASKEIKCSQVVWLRGEFYSIVKIPTATRVAMQLFHTSNPPRNVAVSPRPSKVILFSIPQNKQDAKLNSGVKPLLPSCQACQLQYVTALS